LTPITLEKIFDKYLAARNPPPGQSGNIRSLEAQCMPKMSLETNTVPSKYNHTSGQWQIFRIKNDRFLFPETAFSYRYRSIAFIP
jgi:hypothetical protein